MDQWAGIIWDAATRLFRCTKAQAAYVYKLEENVESLKRKRSELQNREQDVKGSIQSAERTAGKRRTNEVNGWLQDVQNLEKEMEDILDSQEVHNDKCLSGYCPKNCVLSYKSGKKIVKMLNNVDDLLSKGVRFDNIGNIAQELPPKLVVEMPTVETVGLGLMLNRVWNSIEDENVGIIGLYGMGGVGKTTLMKSIHNEFGKREHTFDPVLWVVVSRDCDINKIMTDIHNRLRIVDNNTWNASSKDQRATMIYQHLKEKIFVLMLDDLWGRLELEMVGVPLPKETKNKSKVLFTTRSKDVCAKMKAQKKFKVECLLEREALDLFCEKVGDATLKSHGEIPKLVEEMAKECKGLPLALSVVGGSMAGVKSVEAWREAKNDLSSSPWTASDLEDKVFHILKFSYDKLPDETHKRCFLYCALYPEDYVVDVDDLIDRWIGEGFFHTDKSIYDMYGQGKSIVEKLKLSCLLEGVENRYIYRWGFGIKMHDVIRDMALWLARDQDGNKDKVAIEGEALAMLKMDSERLNVVERISIMNLGGEMWKVPACPNLITLCLIVTTRQVSPWTLFGLIYFVNPQSMKRLRVLDLSGRAFISSDLPSEIGELINLEFLNLSGATLRRLPIELKNLKNLRVFLMENVTGEFEIISLEVIIESLEQLKVFRFNLTSWLSIKKIDPTRENTLLEKLESLPKLEELCIQLNTITGIRKLLSSTKLQGCSRHFNLNKISDPLEMPSLLASFSRMKHLDLVSFLSVNNIMEGSSIIDTYHLSKLHRVRIERCQSITHLTWLKCAPLLESLFVGDCVSIEEVVKDASGEDGGSNRHIANDIFPNLAHLQLLNVPKLKSIHKRALALPLLKYVRVSGCHNLRKLPLNSNSAAKDSLISIEGETEWWNNLEWEDTDTAIKHLLHSKFQPHIIEGRIWESLYRDVHPSKLEFISNTFLLR